MGFLSFILSFGRGMGFLSAVVGPVPYQGFSLLIYSSLLAEELHLFRAGKWQAISTVMSLAKSKIKQLHSLREA